MSSGEHSAPSMSSSPSSSSTPCSPLLTPSLPLDSSAPSSTLSSSHDDSRTNPLDSHSSTSTTLFPPSSANPFCAPSGSSASAASSTSPAPSAAMDKLSLDDTPPASSSATTDAGGAPLASPSSPSSSSASPVANSANSLPPVHEPTAVLTEEAAQTLQTAAADKQEQEGAGKKEPLAEATPTTTGGAPMDKDKTPTASPSTASPAVSPSAVPPPPLVPRASAPPAPGQAGPAVGGVRRPPVAGGALKAGVRGAPGVPGGPLKMPPSLAAKMAAMTARSSAPSPSSSSAASPIPSLKPSSSAGGAPPALAPRPPPRPAAAAGSAPPGRLGAGGPLAGQGGRPMGGMAARRGLGGGKGPGLTLSQMGAGVGSDEGGASPAPGGGGLKMGGLAARRAGGGMKLPGGMGGGAGGSGGDGDEPQSPTNSRGNGQGQIGGTPFSNFRKIVDPSGRLNFASKAILHADGVDFSSGASFKIKMDDFELFEELGKGNYGTVQKVLHRPTGVTMALKEIRLELDDSKLKTIITELDILHRATSPFIIDFYGAFFIESCVYYCMEFMDAGSLDFFAGTDIPEDVLARITRSMVAGLRFLKDELKIMHRDVKPTNVLLNKKGYVKLCDFGVSGQLDRSLAKTNIGCQSYMAPERIKGESLGAATSYTASSDVWSLGLSIIEAAIGHYPYPPETYSNVFAQLTAIVHGDPPALPSEYSETARDFVSQCLIKRAADRPTYKQLMEHPWLAEDAAKGSDGVDMVGWIERAMKFRETNPKINAPALA
ncbi:hypothetical protein JCM8547_003628 [Rhodosporidiobolus lusitaniae]